jgi:hypothetical protein
MKPIQVICKQIESNFNVKMCDRYDYQFLSLFHNFERSVTFHLKVKQQVKFTLLPDLEAPEG